MRYPASICFKTILNTIITHLKTRCVHWYFVGTHLVFAYSDTTGFERRTKSSQPSSIHLITNTCTYIHMHACRHTFLFLSFLCFLSFLFFLLFLIYNNLFSLYLFFSSSAKCNHILTNVIYHDYSYNAGECCVFRKHILVLIVFTGCCSVIKRSYFFY